LFGPFSLRHPLTLAGARRQLGDVAALRTYFDGEAPSLAMHFRILEAFDASS